MDENLIFDKVITDLKTSPIAVSGNAEYFEKLLRYTRISSRENYGLPMLKMYKILAGPDKQTPENYELLSYLSVAIDMFYSCFVIIDDMLDKSDLRGGKPCWYKVVGMEAAANDSHLILAGIFYILKKYFSHLDCYVKLIELLSQQIFACAMAGQKSISMSQENYDEFTQDNYDKLTINQSSNPIHIFFMVIMNFAGITNSAVYEKTEGIFQEIGYLVLVQNDFRECFTSKDSNGKIGNDIEQRKCNWFAVQCLKLASPEQKQIFYDNYGMKNEENIQKIKNLYEEMNLRDVYKEFLKNRCLKLQEKVKDYSEYIPVELIEKVLGYLFKKDF